MNEKVKDFAQMITAATDYLRTTLRYHPCTVNKHNRNWRWMKAFMNAKGIQHYNQKVEKRILSHRFRLLDDFGLRDFPCIIHIQKLFLIEVFYKIAYSRNNRVDRCWLGAVQLPNKMDQKRQIHLFKAVHFLSVAVLQKPVQIPLVAKNADAREPFFCFLIFNKLKH